VLKRVPLLNPRLLALLAGAGHTDLIVIADAGLPIPPGVELIDLIRTGECTPYANVGLIAGVSF